MRSAFACGVAASVLLVAAANAAPVDRAVTVHAIEAAIQKTYVFPELRGPLVTKLEASLAAHRYDMENADDFAQAVTDDMTAVAHDGHLYLNNDAQQFAALNAPQKPDSGMDAYYRDVAIRTNSGLEEEKILPGNIRYLRISGFHWTAALTPRAYDDAARFLKDGAALIVDLRGNGGGDSDAADYFLKTIVKPNRGKPIYILVDGHVASAGEAVPYFAQQAKQALVVGSATYGAANNNKKFPIAPQFVLSVSYNRPINPISHTNWEGTGVIPDIAVPGSQALQAAELDALTKLASKPGVSNDTRADFAWARAAIEAERHPVVVSREVLRTYAGVYGTITLRLADDGLRLSRTDRPRWEQDALLKPIDQNTFDMQGGDDLRVRVTPNSLFLLHGSEDAKEEFPRSKATR